MLKEANYNMTTFSFRIYRVYQNALHSLRTQLIYKPTFSLINLKIHCVGFQSYVTIPFFNSLTKKNTCLISLYLGIMTIKAFHSVLFYYSLYVHRGPSMCQYCFYHIVNHLDNFVFTVC